MGKSNKYYVSYAKINFKDTDNVKPNTFYWHKAQTLCRRRNVFGRNVIEGKNFLFCTANAIHLEDLDLNPVINSKCKNEIMGLDENYSPHKTKSTGPKLNIVLSNEIPVCMRPRRFGSAKQKIIHDTGTWLKEGIIRNSCSDYAAPVVLCKKKDNSHRICIHYRKLNRKIVKDMFSLSLIEDVLDRLVQ